jgi:hypothetical protein
LWCGSRIFNKEKLVGKGWIYGPFDWQFSKIKDVVLTQDHSSKKRIKRSGQKTYLEPPVLFRKRAHLLNFFQEPLN